jgi:hypothetical protein
MLMAQTECGAIRNKCAWTVNGRFSEGIWQYGEMVDFECFQVWLFNFSGIWSAVEDLHFRVGHGLWAFAVVKHPQITRYWLSALCTDVIPLCMK